MKKVKVRVKKDGHQLINDTLDSAIEYGMNRCDRYCSKNLEAAQRLLLRQEISNAFWVLIEEEGIEIE